MSRIGVFICHCGMNIAKTVRISELAEFSSTLPEVVLAGDYKFMCSTPGQELIQNDIKKHNLDRVIVVRDGEMELGILADEIVGISDIPASRLEPAPQAGGLRADHVRGVVDGGLILLDVRAVLGDPRLLVNEEVEA